MTTENYEAFVADIFDILRSRAAEARAKRLAADDRYEYGYETALIAALMAMQLQAKTFGLDLARLKMADFDPLVDELDPNENPPRRGKP
jgi:hypothetical protein